MNPYGDGSDGALNVASGTRNLELNKKHQFTTVNVAAGATLSTTSTTGAVLYIAATESITINGTVNVSNKVLHGDNAWSVTIDGATYISPGVKPGGQGDWYSGSVIGAQFKGFGGGGSGDSARSVDGVSYLGGNGGSANEFSPDGGDSAQARVTSNGNNAARNNGINGGGGSGVAIAYVDSLSGGTVDVRGYSGAGGETWGANGADGGVGTYSGTGYFRYYWVGGGGGGAGGRAGKAGVHVVLRAPVVAINGKIVSSGTSGMGGGNGGRTRDVSGFTDNYGRGGGGGGGGNGGSVEVLYGSSLINTGSIEALGGSGGLGGGGAIQLAAKAGNGSSGAEGLVQVQRIKPYAQFTSNKTQIVAGEVVTFMPEASGGVTFEWSFGDGSVSSEASPSHIYTLSGTYTVSFSATNQAGTDTHTKTNYIEVSSKQYHFDLESKTSRSDTAPSMEEFASIQLTSYGFARGEVRLITAFQPLPQKDYEYRVFNPDGTYRSTWTDVTSEFSYSQNINENASELNVHLARSPKNRTVMYDYLLDTDGQVITDSNNDPIMLHTETANSVGTGTDVDYNLRVEVYAFYGGYETLQDTNGEDILDTDGDPILTQYGAPNGKRVYSGYIADYELVYGNEMGVDVVIVPHATEMSHYIFKNATNQTTVKYLNTDPVKMARDAMDNYKLQGGYIDYLPETMPLSGQSTDYEFKLQTPREAIEKSTELMPAGWYQFVHPGENRQYMLPMTEIPHHVFYYEKHITEFRLRRTITQLVNKVYFAGGEISEGVDLFKYYEDTSSISTYRPGLLRLSDSRVTLDSSAKILSERQIEELKKPRYRSTVTITDAVYDIETIQLGQMVGFKNFGNSDVDELVLQIVGVARKKHSVTLTLDMSLSSSAKRLETLRRQIEQEQIRNIPATPA